MDTAALIADLDATLQAAGRPDRAVQERRYLKSTLIHWGVPVPAVRAAVRQAVLRHGPLAHQDIVEAVRRLWSAPVHERRLAAVELLAGHARQLGVDDLDLVEELLRQGGTWALVDPLADAVAGRVVATHGDDTAVTARLDRWVGDGTMWLRRAALLAHLRPLRLRDGPAAGDPHAQRFLRYADAMLDDREFFIRKAIGWVLRDTGRRRPDLVTGWLLPRAGRAAGLTVREAVKHLPDSQRAAVLAARTASGW